MKKSKKKNKVGRPTEYSEDILSKVEEYLDLKRPNKDEVVPSIEGLALYIDIARSTIYEWINHKDKNVFSDIVSKILEKQARILINKGLSDVFNSSITKIMLTKHGYRDSQEVTGKDGTPLQEKMVIVLDN